MTSTRNKPGDKTEKRGPQHKARMIERIAEEVKRGLRRLQLVWAPLPMLGYPLVAAPAAKGAYSWDRTLSRKR